MGKTYCLAAAIVILAVSWVSADSQSIKKAVKPVEKTAIKQLKRSVAHPSKKPAPLFIRPGLVVKTQFSSAFPGRHDDIKLQSDTGPDIENDPFFKEEIPRGPEPQVAPREEGFRNAENRRRGPDGSVVNPNTGGTMAPAPGAAPRDGESFGVSAQTGERGQGQGVDLEKDLVLSPPPRENTPHEPSVRTRGADRGREPAGDMAGRNSNRSQARKTNPRDYGRQASSLKRIVKVRPVTQSGWSVPAGAYQSNDPRTVAEGYSHDGYRNITPPPTAERFIRDGVTIKLAPQAQGRHPNYEGRSSDDLLSTAADIVGMPFAFVSSFF